MPNPIHNTGQVSNTRTNPFREPVKPLHRVDIEAAMMDADGDGPQIPRPSQVESSIASILEQVERIEKASAVLLERIEPITRQPIPEPREETAKLEEQSVVLASRLDSIASRLNDIAGTLNSVTRRIEL